MKTECKEAHIVHYMKQHSRSNRHWVYHDGFVWRTVGLIQDEKPSPVTRENFLICFAPSTVTLQHGRTWCSISVIKSRRVRLEEMGGSPAQLTQIFTGTKKEKKKKAREIVQRRVERLARERIKEGLWPKAVGRTATAYPWFWCSRNGRGREKVQYESLYYFERDSVVYLVADINDGFKCPNGWYPTMSTPLILLMIHKIHC